jgi:serine/threonine protein kinase
VGFIHTHRCIVKIAKRSEHHEENALDWSEIRNEARILTTLANKHQDVHERCQRCYYADERVRYSVLEGNGISLHTLLRWGTAKWHIASHLIGAVSAVEWLHARGVMHGNIRPESLICTTTAYHRASLKLSDFTRACVHGDLLIPTSTHRSWFSAPEADTATVASVSMDMFSLGLVIWQMLHNTARPALETKGSSVLAKLCSEQDALIKFLVWPTSWVYMKRVVVHDPGSRVGAALLKHRLCESLQSTTFATVFEACMRRSSQKLSGVYPKTLLSPIDSCVGITGDASADPMGAGTSSCDAAETERTDHVSASCCGALAEPGHRNEIRNTSHHTVQLPPLWDLLTMGVTRYFWYGPSEMLTARDWQQVAKAVEPWRNARGNASVFAVYAERLLNAIREPLSPRPVIDLTGAAEAAKDLCGSLCAADADASIKLEEKEAAHPRRPSPRSTRR